MKRGHPELEGEEDMGKLINEASLQIFILSYAIYIINYIFV